MLLLVPGASLVIQKKKFVVLDPDPGSEKLFIRDPGDKKSDPGSGTLN
jgi:hypothetical protein